MFERNGILLLIATLFFFSCGSLNPEIGKEDNQENGFYQMEIASLKSKLVDVKDDLTAIKLQNQNKDVFIEKLQAQIKVMEKQITYLTKNQIKDIKPPVLYKKARNLLIEENYLIAGELFTNFIKKFPEHDLAGNAAYWLGECYYSLSEYKKAITVFIDLVSQYPKSGKVPGAILKTGYAYLSLNDSNRAHHYLKKVLRTYPFSPAAEKAQEKLKNFE
ncbi:MAG: tol-pal system protein YbgF [Desulfobacula sp.]|nr:tol-pal system protein YbgF [Desulfobacula sp.]